MENMIKKIIDADNEAKLLEEYTLKEKAELSKKIDAEIQKIHDSYMAKADKTVKANIDAEEKKAKQKWDEIQQKHKSILIKLKADFERNQDRWADEIVKRTIAQ